MNNMNLRDLIREMSKVVPSSYLASLEFFTEILNSPYRDIWARNANSASNYAHSYILNKPDLRNEQAEDTMASMCQELLNKGKEALYKYIVFLIKSYCRNSEEKKVEIRGLKIALRSIGISDFDEIEEYAKDPPLIESVINIDRWPDISNAIDKIQQSCSIAQSEIDFQNMGNSCRDLIISLAKIVYDPSVHGNKNEEGKDLFRRDRGEVRTTLA